MKLNSIFSIKINNEIFKNHYYDIIDYLSKKALIVLITLVLLILCYFFDYKSIHNFYYITHSLIIMFGFYFLNKNIELKNKDENNITLNYLYQKFICVAILTILLIIINLLDIQLFPEKRYLAYIFVFIFCSYGVDKLIYR